MRYLRNFGSDLVQIDTCIVLIKSTLLVLEVLEHFCTFLMCVFALCLSCPSITLVLSLFPPSIVRLEHGSYVSIASDGEHCRQSFVIGPVRLYRLLIYANRGILPLQWASLKHAMLIRRRFFVMEHNVESNIVLEPVNTTTSTSFAIKRLYVCDIVIQASYAFATTYTSAANTERVTLLQFFQLQSIM